MQHLTLGIDQDVPLLAFDLLASVIAMRIDVGAALFGAFDALGIDDRCGRTVLTRGSLAAFDAEGVVDAVQRSIPAPAIEIVVYCAARGQILGDCAPLAAGAEDVHQAVDHLAQVDRALIATRFGRWDQRSDLRPFFIGQVTLIAQPAAVIAGAVLLGPHGMPPKIDAGAGNGNGISGFKTNPLTDSNDSVCSRTDTKTVVGPRWFKVCTDIDDFELGDTFDAI